MKEFDKRLNRRDILTLGAGIVAGAVGSKIAEHSREPDKQLEDGKAVDTEPSQIGQIQEIMYRPVGGLAYFQTNSPIETILDLTKTQISFDKDAGGLRILDEAGRELSNFPGAREISGVFVASDGVYLTFEYKGTDSSSFGVTVGRSLENGRFVTKTWDTDLKSH
jgi:hypothetical protein